MTRKTLLAGMAVLAGLLGACSLGSGPDGMPGASYSHRAAAEAISLLPGITSAEVSSSTEGTPNQVLLMARVSADAGYTGDSADLLDYILRQAWSTTETRPTTTVRVELLVEGQDPGLEALAGRLGLDGNVEEDNKYEAGVRIGVQDMAATYGPWPGVPPATLPAPG